MNNDNNSRVMYDLNNIKIEKLSDRKLLVSIDIPVYIGESKISSIKLSARYVEDFTNENIKNVLMQIANTLENRGELLHPVRYALSGLDKSPDPFVIADILGKNETLSRLQKAI